MLAASHIPRTDRPRTAPTPQAGATGVGHGLTEESVREMLKTKTLKEIGDEHGITKERVRQIANCPTSIYKSLRSAPLDPAPLAWNPQKPQIRAAIIKDIDRIAEMWNAGAMLVDIAADCKRSVGAIAQTIQRARHNNDQRFPRRKSWPHAGKPKEAFMKPDPVLATSGTGLPPPEMMVGNGGSGWGIWSEQVLRPLLEGKDWVFVPHQEGLSLPSMRQAITLWARRHSTKTSTRTSKAGMCIMRLDSMMREMGTPQEAKP